MGQNVGTARDIAVEAGVVRGSEEQKILQPHEEVQLVDKTSRVSKGGGGGTPEGENGKVSNGSGSAPDEGAAPDKAPNTESKYMFNRVLGKTDVLPLTNKIFGHGLETLGVAGAIAAPFVIFLDFKNSKVGRGYGCDWINYWSHRYCVD